MNTVSSTELTLTEDGDKVFPESDRVNHHKVVFPNRYGILLAADVYEPKTAERKLPAIAISGPFGAVKEQASGLYAQKLAEMGYCTLAFDPSFTKESGGFPRRVASPDINTEDFSAAVDFLSNTDKVDPERIGILGICGFGGMALNAASNDPRIKAAVTSTMYNMSENISKGYFDTEDSKEARNAKRAAIARQRTIDFKNRDQKRGGGVVNPVPADAPQFIKDYHDYYKTPRGYHPRSGNCTDGWNVTGTASFLNMRLNTYIDEIEAPVLLIHGEKAHSLSYSKEAYSHLKGENKELLIIPGASHTDLYDQMAIIPFAKIDEFYTNAFR